MFGELEKYKKKEFYNNHKVINFKTIYENADYEIIAVFKTVTYTGFEYYKFVNSSSKQEFDTFIKKCKELSFYETEKTAQEYVENKVNNTMHDIIYYTPRLNRKGKQNFEKTIQNIEKGKVQIKKHKKE